MTTAGKVAQWYFADAGLRSVGATASIIICFSSGVRSRWPMLTEGDGASRVPVVHPESAKPMASGAIKLRLDICKARCVVGCYLSSLDVWPSRQARNAAAARWRSSASLNLRRGVSAFPVRCAVGPTGTEPTRKNRTRNNRPALVLGGHGILCSHRRSGRRSTASALPRHARSDNGH